MRIVQPCGPSHRDDGGPFYVKGQLNLIPGVTCDRYPVTASEDTWGEYDAVIEVDWGQDCEMFSHLPLFRPNPNKPSVCWQSDTHYNEIGWTYRMNEASFYRAAAFAQKNAADAFAAGPPSKQVAWLPHAADHTVYTPPLKDYWIDLSTIPPDPEAYRPYIHDIIPEYDLCFVGHPSDEGRNEILDTIFKAFPNFAWRSGVFFRHAARVFHRSRIVFNAAIRHEINMRTFEALATRSFLLTDRQQGMDLLGLKDGVHCAMYDSLEEAIDKGHWYLDPKREALRRHIADQGWRWYLNGHSYYHRVRRLLEMVGWKG